MGGEGRHRPRLDSGVLCRFAERFRVPGGGPGIAPGAETGLTASSRPVPPHQTKVAQRCP